MQQRGRGKRCILRQIQNQLGYFPCAFD